MKKIGIIGAGASGLYAAINLKTSDNEVSIIERNNTIGKKLLITGNGRCNITNAKFYDDFLENIVTNKKFLYSSFKSHDNYSTMDFFEKKYLPLIIEEDGRVFPKSQNSKDVINFFKKEIYDKKINLILNTKALDIIKDDKFIVKTENKDYEFDILIIATGGLSYKVTGSDGDGYEFAKKMGHKINKTYPSLVPIYYKDRDLFDIKALSLKNVKLIIKTDKDIYSDFGDILISKNLLTGPLVIKLSSFIVKDEIVDIWIDLFPKYFREKLDEFFINEFMYHPNKDISNILKIILPNLLVDIILNRATIKTYKKANQITKEERILLIDNIKKFHINFSHLGGYNLAVITKGGVDTNNINPKTMESKLITNLFFIGEVLDIDGLTGGYNLQIAFSTANAAAKAIKERL